MTQPVYGDPMQDPTPRMGSAPTPPAPEPPPLEGEDLNAYQFLTQMLEEWGLGSLAPDVLKLIQDGYTQQQIPVLLQNTDAYKQRFIGNQARREKGLAVLSPSEYLQVERSYRQIMMNAGLPDGFYDNAADFAGFIGNDVSPVEIQRRVDEASDAIYRMDATTAQTFLDMYGLTPQDLTAYLLDANRGRDAINRVVHGGRIAGAARSMGIDLTVEQAERYGAMSGKDYMTEAQQFGQLAALGERLSALYAGDDYMRDEAASEVWQGSGDALRRRRQLVAREQAEFSGGSGFNRKSLAQSAGQY